MNNTIVDLIRHGQPQGGSLYRGHTIDDPLSELGWQQMWDAVGEHKKWQHIVSSPMLRCKAFSQSLAEKLNISMTFEDNLKEVGFGCWEGLTREQVKQKNVTEYNRFYADPVNNRAEGFENLNFFIQRVISTYNNIIKEFSGQHILIVAHAGVIRAVLAHIIEAPASGLYKIKIENAGISQVNASTQEIMFINKKFKKDMISPS